ncbi:hypothetical protein [Vreelandella glaciei]|uniref:hypothetical protein n=1 Tax=Vreelandella glaciei TaxID=186761 RepID=UPI0030EB545E
MINPACVHPAPSLELALWEQHIKRCRTLHSVRRLVAVPHGMAKGDASQRGRVASQRESVLVERPGVSARSPAVDG